MRFLHTSDWHIGKPLRGYSREAEYVAALEEVLAIAKHERVDAVLVAGDVFDSSVPSPDAERVVFHFLTELVGASIPAVIIAGNHDHPKRMNAYASLLARLGIRVIGEPVLADEGGIVTVAARESGEIAVIAAMPWISERKIRDFDDLMKDGKHFEQYASGVAELMDHLSASFRMDSVNLFLAHVLLEDAIAGGPESGERPLHMGDAYAVRLQQLPKTAQYIALGHVHNPKQPDAFALANAYYSGSLLQCDFGEQGQTKGARLIEATAGRQAKVEFLPFSSTRQLINVWKDKKTRAGYTLDEIAALKDEMPDAYLKVWVKVDRPFPGLAEQVREMLPNAVDIVVERTDVDRPEGPRLEGMSPQELFAAYYARQHESEPAPELTALFNRLLEEATSAAD